MSFALTRTLGKLCVARKPSFYAIAKASELIRDNKPGPYPTSDEARLAAAERYGIHPDDYKPCPLDKATGDYPDVPTNSGDARDPYYPWDCPELKRNYGEIINENADAYGEDRLDVDTKQKYSDLHHVLMFTGVMLGFWVLHLIGENFKIFIGATPRQYPNKGKVHYTFEPAE